MTFGLTGGGFLLGAAGLITAVAATAQLAQNRSFRKDGTAYARSVPAAPSEHSSWEIGHSIELTYKPSNPKKCIRADNLSEKSEKTLRIVAICAAAAAVLGAVLFLLGQR